MISTLFGICVNNHVMAFSVIYTRLSHLFLVVPLHSYVITYGVMPVYWQWLNRISPTTWIIYGLVAGVGGRCGWQVCGAGVGGRCGWVSAPHSPAFPYHNQLSRRSISSCIVYRHFPTPFSPHPSADQLGFRQQDVTGIPGATTTPSVSSFLERCGGN